MKKKQQQQQRENWISTFFGGFNENTESRYNMW